MPAFDLYFDESGSFEDAALCEEGIVRHDAPQKSSQLAGMLAPAGMITPASADRLLAAAHRSAGMGLEKRLHATELLQRGRHFA